MTSRETTRIERIMNSSPVYCLLPGNLNRRHACVQRSVLKVEVNDESVIDVLLNVERDLRSAKSLVGRITDLRWNVEERVVIRMRVKDVRNRKRRRWVEIDIDLRQMLR